MERDLRRLATAHGVVTAYDAADGRRTQVDRDIVVRVLGLLDVDATTREAIRAALATAEAETGLPPTIVLRDGDRRPLERPGTVTLEDGGTREVTELRPTCRSAGTG